MALTLWSVMTIFAGETAYLFSYFINDSKDGLHLAYSYDGPVSYTHLTLPTNSRV